MEKFTDRYRERIRNMTKLAEHLGCTRQWIYQWDVVPAELVPKVEEFTGIPRTELRPDLWEPND